MAPLAEKTAALAALLQEHSPLLIAYSGGVDSAFLLWFAVHRSDAAARGILADSPSLKRSELSAALAFAGNHNLPVDVIRTSELDDPDYRANPPNRCFFCKAELFRAMEERARASGARAIAYGENADDLAPDRPGSLAAAQFHVLSPLKSCGLTKADIRSLARAANLEVSEKLAQPCLSSRIPHGLTVTPDKLRRIEEGEAALTALGFRIVRVRHADDHALVQVGPDETPRLLNDPVLQAQATSALLAAGFPAVRFDPLGYRGAGLR